jgi:hypothetical protein
MSPPSRSLERPDERGLLLILALDRDKDQLGTASVEQ